MSDFLDILKSAREKGIILDSCGSDERQKTWGLYTDLCGMSVEDALKGQNMAVIPSSDTGSSEDKKTNTVVFAMQQSGDEYELVLSTSNPPEGNVVVTFSFNGDAQTVVIPAGTSKYNTGLKGDSKYATISNIVLASDDEKYKYAYLNNVQDGYFTLEFTDEDGNVIKEESVYYGTSGITFPPTPDEYAVGYDYDWVLEDGTVVTEDSFVMPENPVKINGVPKIHKFTLAINKPDGTVENIPNVEYNTPFANIDAIEDTDREGYTFRGWFTDEEFNEPLPERMPDGENGSTYEIYGKWDINSYTIIYKVDGNDYASEVYEYNAPISIISEPSAREGYTFSGWVIDGYDELPETMPANDILVNGQYNINSHTIIYHVTEIREYAEPSAVTRDDVVVTYNYGETIQRYTPSKDGYDFEPWKDENGDMYEIPATMPDEDIEVWGELIAWVYSYAFRAEGEAVLSGNASYGMPIPDPEQYYVEHDNYGEYIEKVLSAKTGYSFVEWKYGNENVPEYFTMQDLLPNFTAEYTVNTYTVNYFVDGEAYSSETYEYGATVTAIAEPSKEGYTFGGWVGVPQTMPANDVTVNGEFTINEYSITYMVDGEPYSSETYEYHATVTAIDEPSKEGYTFGGWQGVPEVMPAMDVVVNGMFSINSYTINYIVDGEPYSSETYEYHAAVSPIAEPSKEGHTFGGWSEIPEIMPANDVTVVGSFTVNQYTITYIISADTISAETYDYGERIVPISVEPIVGHTFSGWQGIPETMPASDIEVYGEYILNEWTVTYNISGESSQVVGGVPSPATVPYGSEIPYPEIVVNDGYRFVWDDSFSGATMPDNDITIDGYVYAFVADTNIYYGVANNNDLDGLSDSDITAYDSFKAVTGDTEVVFTIPAYPNYNEIIAGLNRKERTEFMNSMHSSFVITVPADIQNKITLTDSDEFVYPLVKHKDIVINETDYAMLRHTDEGAINQGAEDQELAPLIIRIN